MELIIYTIIFILIIAGMVKLSNVNEAYKKEKFGEEKYNRLKAEKQYIDMINREEMLSIREEKKHNKKIRKKERNRAVVNTLIMCDFMKNK